MPDTGAVSLDELKKEVEAEETAAAAKAIADEKAADDAYGQDDGKPTDQDDKKPGKSEENDDNSGEKDEGTDDDKTQDDKSWMKPDEDDDKDDKSGKKAEFTGEDVKAVRIKYKAQAKEAKDRAAELERENAELKKKLDSKPAADTSGLQEPDRADFETESAYIGALTRHHAQLLIAEEKSKGATDEIAKKRAARTAEIEKAVDEHYVRAATLAKASNITPENYQAADLAVRKVVDSVFSEAGDTITDALIARLGPGSEKVMYHIGFSAKKQAKLKELLQQDTSGVAASMWLGELKAELKANVRKSSRTPEPQDEIRGDKASGAGGGQARVMRDNYRKAMDAGDTQTGFDLKRAAKGKKIDTSSW